MVEGEKAEWIAVQAFQWLARDEEQLMTFLAQSGADMADLREMAGEPQFLASILDFVLFSDDSVLALAAALRVKPEDVAHARQVLPGAEDVHWT